MKSRIESDMRRAHLLKVLMAGLFCLLFSLPEAGAQNGESLFKTNCSSCHDAGSKRSTGPGLAGVTRRRNMDWILKWVANPADLVNAGDADAVAILKDFNNFMMPPQTVKPEEITAIMKFIEDKETADIKKRADDSIAKAAAEKSMKNAAPPKQPLFSKQVLIFLSIIGVVLLALYFFLSHVNQTMVDAVGRGLPYFDNSEGGFMDKWISGNKAFVFFLSAGAIGACVYFIKILLDNLL